MTTLEWVWRELFTNEKGFTCERCWHSVAHWFCETTRVYHCSTCKRKISKNKI